jgi:hypothetical protein
MQKSVNYMLAIAAVTAGAGKESDSVAGTPAECNSTQGSGVAAARQTARANARQSDACG